jgi:hypothetical protein
MRLTRLRSGELLALAGALAASVASLLPWYRTAAGRTLDGWSDVGPAIVLIVLGVAAALAMVVLTVGERSPALPVAAAVWSTLLGILALIGGLIAVLQRPDGAVALRPAAWIALVASAAIALGGWQSMRDERTELYEPATPTPRAPPPP